MKLMGLVDADAAILEGQESDPIPIDQDFMEILAVAISHMYFPQHHCVGISDGYYTLDQLPQCTGGRQSVQCRCIAHQAVLFCTDKQKREDIKAFVQSPHRISSADKG